MWPEQPHVHTLDYAYEEAQAVFGNDPRQYSIQTKSLSQIKRPFERTAYDSNEKVKNDQGKFEFHEIPGTEKYGLLNTSLSPSALKERNSRCLSSSG
ncbi:hypothetical protein PO124_18755 [Bacillus licheniformis]|nr:hypothetical protein [Bacillus licheniformis]